jgi:hypothetical protein
VSLGFADAEVRGNHGVLEDQILKEKQLAVLKGC